MENPHVISSIDDIRHLLEERRVKIVGVGGTPMTRSEIYPMAPFFETICSVPSSELSSVRKKVRVNHFSVVDSVGMATKKPEKILSHQQVLQYIFNKNDCRTVGIYTMKPHKIIEDICRQYKGVFLGNTAAVMEKYNDKNAFKKILSSIGIPARSISVSLSSFLAYPRKFFSLFGDTIVVQFPKSEGGKGTFFFDKDDIVTIKNVMRDRMQENDIKTQDSLMVSAYIHGQSLSIMGCITRENGILSVPPQYQLIDIPEVTAKKSNGSGVFCGHDWALSNSIPKHIENQAKNIVEKIGTYLHKDGVLGIFGVDLMWDTRQDILVPIEINVRLTGAFPVIVQNQIEMREIPLVGFHILDFLHIPYKIEYRPRNPLKRTVAGAHLLVFNPYAYDIRCIREIPGGVYSLKDHSLHFERPGFELGDIEKQDEFVLTDGTPVRGSIYKKNRKIMRIISRSSISKDPNTLNVRGKNIVSAVYKAIVCVPQ